MLFDKWYRDYFAPELVRVELNRAPTLDDVSVRDAESVEKIVARYAIFRYGRTKAIIWRQMRNALN